MNALWGLVCVLLSLSSAALSWLPQIQAAVTPVKRTIVKSLSDDLKQQLVDHKIRALLVFPGSKDPTNVAIQWSELSDVVRVEFIRSFDDFTSHWHKSHSREHPAQQRGLKEWQLLPKHRHMQWQAVGRHLLLQLLGPLHAEPHQQDMRRNDGNPSQQHYPRTRVAVLTLGTDGVVHNQQATLAYAVIRRLRNAEVLTFTHNSHRDKPETLVTFDESGFPVAVAVQESTVFRDAFTRIYNDKVWGTGGGGSGEGSTVNYTANVRQVLSGVLQRYNVKSMLDSSCGSMHWMPLVLQEREKEEKDFKFMGTDVVCMLIDRHRATFAQHKNYNFECIDYSAQPLPHGYELVFSRDSLQHVPLHGTWQFLNNVKASGARYLLVGSYVNSHSSNKDVPGGGYYDINLLNPPFNVSKPLEIFDEHTADGKHLLLFDVEAMTWSDPLIGLAR